MESTIKDLKLALSSLNNAYVGLLHHNKQGEAGAVHFAIWCIEKIIVELTDPTR